MVWPKRYVLDIYKFRHSCFNSNFTSFVYFPGWDKSSYSKRNRFISGASTCLIRCEYLLAYFNAILSLAGVLCLYAGMFYIYDNQGLLHVTPSHIASKLGYGTTLTEAPLGIVADYYFFMGIIALILSTAIFRAKGAPAAGLLYPIWSNDKDPKLRYGPAVVSLIPVQSLLSIVEHHLVAKYRYIQIMIGGRIYFVSPDDWVPEHSSVIREKKSGSLLGIPKVPDGFNL